MSRSPASKVAPLPATRRLRFSDDELLDGARAVFHERGYHLAQMDEIAERAGTTKPTLYARLGSKDDVYVRTLEREATAFMEHMDAAYERTAGRHWREAVDIAMTAYVDFVCERPDGFHLLFRSEAGAPVVGTGEEVMHKLILRDIEITRTYYARRGRRAGYAVEIIAAMMVGVCRNAMLQALESGGDIRAAGALASEFIKAAAVGMDRDQIDRVNGRRSGRAALG